MGLDWKIRESHDLGRALLEALSGVGELHSPTVGQGFAVLKAVDIPAVLIETGFMSNLAEEKALQQNSYKKGLLEPSIGDCRRTATGMNGVRRERGMRASMWLHRTILPLIAARLDVSVADLKKENPTGRTSSDRAKTECSPVIRSSLNACDGIDFPVIFLAGTTASGKTALALKLAEEFPIDLVSVDSGQVYRGMDIGTAKPSPDILDRAPHALIDIRNVESPYSAAVAQKTPGDVSQIAAAAGEFHCASGELCFISRRCLMACRSCLQQIRHFGPSLEERLGRLVGKPCTRNDCAS